jgi:hypothetical protein
VSCARQGGSGLRREAEIGCARESHVAASLAFVAQGFGFAWTATQSRRHVSPRGAPCSRTRAHIQSCLNALALAYINEHIPMQRHTPWSRWSNSGLVRSDPRKPLISLCRSSRSASSKAFWRQIAIRGFFCRTPIVPRRYVYQILAVTLRETRLPRLPRPA